jgi:hypothetical protein
MSLYAQFELLMAVVVIVGAVYLLSNSTKHEPC